jgi:hypothetical protein
MINIYYYAMKIFLLASIVRSLVMFEPLRKHWLFLSIAYTGLLFGLCWIFFNWQQGFTQERLQQWAIGNLILSAIYFKLLGKFDEGILFWLILIGGMAGLVYW